MFQEQFKKEKNIEEGKEINVEREYIERNRIHAS